MYAGSTLILLIFNIILVTNINKFTY